MLQLQPTRPHWLVKSSNGAKKLGYTERVKRLYQLLIGALIFLIPSNLFYVLTETGARVHGLRVDYLLPKFYASDVVIVLLIGVYFWNESKDFKKKILSLWNTKRPETTALLLLVLLLFVRQFFATSPTIAVWTAVSWIKMGLLGYVLWQKRAFLHTTQTSLFLAFTLLFQSVVAFWQFFTQQSVAGYWFLGETDLSSFAGLAKTSLGGVERVLPYGTTAHPNVLGGFLFMGTVLLLTKSNKKTDPFLKTAVFICVAFSVITLFLTQSVSAILALILGLLIFAFKEKITIPHTIVMLGIALVTAISIWMPFPNSHPSVARRAYLNQAGLRMFVDHPFIGVGIQNFTTHVEEYSLKKEVVRFVQPAHNAPMLFLAETGLLGVMSVLFSLRLLKRKDFVCILPLLPILLLDHYLLSLQSGLLIAVIFFSATQYKR